MHKAVDEMGKAETFRGYGPEQGYDFLRQAIIDGDYKTRGIDLDLDEVFVGDGAKTDVACIQEIFGSDLKFAVPGLPRLQRHVRPYGRMECRKGHL